MDRHSLQYLVGKKRSVLFPTRPRGIGFGGHLHRPHKSRVVGTWNPREPEGLVSSEPHRQWAVRGIKTCAAKRQSSALAVPASGYARRPFGLTHLKKPPSQRVLANPAGMLLHFLYLVARFVYAKHVTLGRRCTETRGVETVMKLRRDSLPQLTMRHPSGLWNRWRLGVAHE